MGRMVGQRGFGAQDGLGMLGITRGVHAQAQGA